MLFPQHVSGGLIAGTAVAAAQYYSQHYHVLDLPFVPYWLLLGCTFFFAIFPDLDTASVPQRWFYRCLLLTLLTCVYFEQFRIGLWLAILSYLPLLDHHRGWTHHKLAPLVVPLMFLIMIHVLAEGRKHWGQMTLDQVVSLAYQNAWLLFACAIGWYTHLILDGLLIKIK